MALSSTMYTFDVNLSDVDRNVYEALNVRAAQHPSEAAEALLTRLLAYCLEYTEGIGFSKGLQEPDEPAVIVRDLTGKLVKWIDVGTPDANRIHRASKLADAVAIYTYKDAAALVRQLGAERIHKAERIPIHGVDRALIADLVAVLDRRMKLDLMVTEKTLYITLGSRTLTGEVVEHRLG
jgi:uncharacterized protein YaeQ